MAMVTKAEVTTYLTYDSDVFSTWSALTDTQKDWYIERAEQAIDETFTFIGYKSVKTQANPFPRDLTDILTVIQSYYYDRSDYDDILQCYTDIDGTTPDRVKDAIAEQIKWYLLTDDFVMEKAEFEMFEGSVNTNQSNFTMWKETQIAKRVRDLLDPFLVKPVRTVLYAFRK